MVMTLPSGGAAFTASCTVRKSSGTVTCDRAEQIAQAAAMQKMDRAQKTVRAVCTLTTVCGGAVPIKSISLKLCFSISDLTPTPVLKIVAMMDHVHSFVSRQSRREFLAAGAGLAMSRFAHAQTTNPW